MQHRCLRLLVLFVALALASCTGVVEVEGPADVWDAGVWDQATWR